MYGAILGDMIGAPYEFDRSPKTKEFPLFIRYSQFTDDSVMTVAVADALIGTLDKTRVQKASAGGYAFCSELLRQRKVRQIIG